MTHPTAADPAVAPIGLWDRLAIVVLGLAGCALSYDALQQMAVAIHIRGHLTYLFPLVVDGFIAYGVRALLVLSQAPLRARLYVWVLFATATAASIWANALHAVRLNQQTTTHPGLRLSDTVVAILSTLAPLALAGAVHLYILITRHHPGGAPQADQPEMRPVRRGRSTQRCESTRQRATAEAGPTTRTTDHRSAAARDRRTSPTDASHGEHGQAQRSADHSTASVRSHLPTADHRGAHAPADQQTNTTPGHPARDADQAADRALPAADRQAPAGPQEAPHERRTSNDAGQTASGPHGPADHKRADHVRGPAEEPGPVSADQGAPADRMPDHEHPQTADHNHRTPDQPTDTTPADQRTNPAPDHPDHEADQPVKPSADQDEDGSPGGPQGARSHSSPAADQRTKPADQDEVSWEAKVAVARQAALAEGRMTRRAIRPHLRNANISVSNELFSDLQAALYADPTLAHLPRDTRRVR
ncbi:DUF2637 domain-containing protein [Streptomyces sp. p1417]|uniref:DUF2637 domain-containing protein n=1 Tax=Streptomyces typhae TaxID=2681492 RepID=A0A6L6XAE2_9ACTN|nr:DUF2637 domain-containing protein [Streptomyces typhae]